MPLIAMTREMGSLGKDVAGAIAAKTDRKVVYHEIIDPIADKMRLRKSYVERFLDERTKDTDISVECDGGAARLQGLVATPDEARTGEEVAAIVAGVKSVSNQVQATLHAASRARREG